MNRIRLTGWLFGVAGVLTLASGSALAQSQTAQSAMASVTLDSNAYEIQGTITWTFNKAAAEASYTAGAGVWNGIAPTCTGGGPGGVNCASANKPLTPSAPAVPTTGPNSVAFHAQSDRCTFWSGGDLPDWTYTQTATVNGLNGSGNWTFTFNYSSTGSIVSPYTAWTSEVTGGTVNVGFNGFVASESFLSQPGRKYKYSFTMIDSGVTRARNVFATLSGPASGSIDLNNVDTNFDFVNDALAVVPANTDFTYFANGGIFGTSAVFAALHAPAQKGANGVVNILNGLGTPEATYTDNFAGNNNDLASGNVQVGPFAGSFTGLTAVGNYTINISGALKGNGSSADLGFSVASSLITIGGCQVAP